MPIFKLTCPNCQKGFSKLLPNAEAAVDCPDCKRKLVRTGHGATSRVIEVRDNGLMPKKVEQLAGIDELLKNR